jgi:MATE family multidrug resistance protein
MSKSNPSEIVDYATVWNMAWPIILANSAVPLLGLVDTAVIGHVGQTADLGAIALGSLIFNFVYWSFGFLRMGTTGFAAQAAGAGDEIEVRATLGRALLLAAGIGLTLILLQWPIAWLALQMLGAGAQVEEITQSYVLIRIWGAPASLATFAFVGVLIGLGHSRKLLQVQIVLNGLNIVLDLLFAGVVGWGVAGIALGTLVAEWVALGYAALLTYRLLRQRHRDGVFWTAVRVFDTQKLRRLLQANADIMVRTLLLVFGFAWFTDQSARFGDVVLAGNHILLQFISFSAFFLDGFAFAAEPLVGRAVGSGRRNLFDSAVRTSSVLAGGTALILSLLIILGGQTAIAALTDLQPVRDMAARFLPYAAIYALVAFAAFQLDGIFVGTTRTRDMRNASLISVLVFLLVWWPLTAWADNHGLWIAFIVFVIVRAVALGTYYPALRHSIEGPR